MALTHSRWTILGPWGAPTYYNPLYRTHLMGRYLANQTEWGTHREALSVHFFLIHRDPGIAPDRPDCVAAPSWGAKGGARAPTRGAMRYTRLDTALGCAKDGQN